MRCVLVFCLMLSGLCISRLNAGEGDIVQVGQAAPAFRGTASDGTSVDLAALKGRVVLLNFFATWCPPCNEEMPQLEAQVCRPLRDHGLVLLAIGREHSVEEVAAFKAKKHLTFPFVADPDRAIYAQYAASYIPRCYLIGRDGTVKAATVGYDPDEFARLVEAVKQALAH